MKEQRLLSRFGPAWLWPGIALAFAALLLTACIAAGVRSSISVTAVLVRPTIAPVRIPPGTSAPFVPSVPGCLNEQSAQQLGRDALRQLGVFCYEVAPGRIVTVEQAAAVAAIQQLFADPGLQPAFQGLAGMPNAPNGQLPAMFFDDAAQRYWVDLESGRVVEVDVLAQQADWAANPLPEAELRARAEQFVQRAAPGFAAIADRLAYQSSSKDGVLYFYRWEDRDAPGWTNLPPLAQVGITVSGQVVAYLNTLFLANPGSSGPATWTPAPVPTPSPPAPATGMHRAPIGLPLAAGTRWVYDYVAYAPSLSDPTQVITATYRFTETIVDARPSGAYLVAHIERQELGLDEQARSQSFQSSRPGDYWYLVDGTSVYKSANAIDLAGINTAVLPLAYDFPLSADKSWCPFGIDPKDPSRSRVADCDPVRTSVGEVSAYETSIGRFESCHRIVERSNSGSIIQWFCDGVGPVALQYDHSGTRFGFTQTLIDFRPGSP